MIRDWFDTVQRASLTWLEPLNPSMAAAVRALDAIYLYGTIGSEAALLRDGSVRLWVAEGWPHSEDYTERPASEDERIAALVLGGERWPEVGRLLPPRPQGAPDCAACLGSRRVHAIICPTCHGLGWFTRAI